MSLTENKEPSIQMTIYDYFMDSEQFTLDEAVEAVKQVKSVKEPSIRGRIYEGIDKGLFERVSKGVYTVKRKTIDGEDCTCMVVQGNGRDLSFVKDNSIDAIITDHPYDLKKSLLGGNRNFAEYEKFLYTENDFKEKYRVLKDGAFLVEFMPEENGDNFEYIYQVKSMAKGAGFDYFAVVPWKKGDMVANTGRKSKNTENVLFFTKGKCRTLRIDAKKEKEYWKEHEVAEFKDNISTFFDDTESMIEIKLAVEKGNKDRTEEALKNAMENWVYNECENSILLDDETTADDLLSIPIVDYMIGWVEKCGIEFENISEKDKHIYCSGAKGMLPTVFDVEPVKKAEKIHQSEKPVKLLEEILEFITLPKEKVLDQFAGSGVLGEAALIKGRDSMLIEKDEETYRNITKRLNKRR